MKVVLLKHVVLIMQIINVIINMVNIKQVRSDKGATKLNKRFKLTSLNKKFSTRVKESMVLQALKK